MRYKMHTSQDELEPEPKKILPGGTDVLGK